MDLKIYPSSLKGSVVVPPSKSITHRYLICAALSKGKSIIDNPLFCDDTMATISVLKELGAKFKIEKKRIIVKGCRKPKIKERTLTILESATTFRALLPLLLIFSSKLTIVSTKRLIDRIYTSDLLGLRGVNFQRKKHTIVITGHLQDKEIVLSGKITSQLISGVILALPYLNEGTTLRVKDTSFNNPYIALTLKAIKKFGIDCIIENNIIKSTPKAKYIRSDAYVEGDYSNGAVWLAAACFHHEIKVTGLKLDSLQGDAQIIEYLKAMNIAFNYIDNVFTFKKGSLQGTTLNIEETPDLAPILVVVASKADGQLNIQGTSKLKYKESNRKLAIMEVVNKLGGVTVLNEDDILINGRKHIAGGGDVSSYNDHRIVMATTILATISDNPVIIKDFQVVNKSYPNFFVDLANLGAKFEVI